MASQKQLLENIWDELRTQSADQTDRAAPGALWSNGERLTVSNTVIPLTEVKYGDRTLARIQVQNESIRFRYNGDDPTASNGELANPRDQIILENASEIAQFRMCAAASDAIAEISYGFPA